MRAVDTNVLVRLVVGDAPDQVDVAKEFVSKGIWVSHVVLAETTWVLDAAYGLRSGQIAAAVEMFLRHEQVALQDADVVEAALEGFRRRSAVSFSDHLILEIARKSGHLPLGTFDRDLAKVEGTERL